MGRVMILLWRKLNRPPNRGSVYLAMHICHLQLSAGNL